MSGVRWDAVTVDCADPDRLAAFWAALLQVEVRGRWRQYVGLHPARDGHPRMVFQRVEGVRPEHNSLHLDLHVAGREALRAEVARVVALGAGVVRTEDDGEACWTVLTDPEGNLFCLVAD